MFSSLTLALFVSGTAQAVRREFDKLRNLFISPSENDGVNVAEATKAFGDFIARVSLYIETLASSATQKPKFDKASATSPLFQYVRFNFEQYSS